MRKRMNMVKMNLTCFSHLNIIFIIVLILIVVIVTIIIIFLIFHRS